MNTLKPNVAVFSSLLFFLFADVDTAASAYAEGKLGKALILDGNSHTVKVSHYARLQPDKAITISAWIKPERVGKGSWTWQQIYRKEDGKPELSWQLASPRRITGSVSAWGSAETTSNIATLLSRPDCSSGNGTQSVEEREANV